MRQMGNGLQKLFAWLMLAHAPNAFAQATITLPDTDVTVSVSEGSLTLTPAAYNAPGSIGYYARNQRSNRQDVCLIELSSTNVSLENTHPVARSYFEKNKLLPLTLASAGSKFRVFSGKNQNIEVRYVFYQKNGSSTQSIIKSCNLGSNDVFSVTFFPDRSFLTTSLENKSDLDLEFWPKSMHYSIDDYSRAHYRQLPKQTSFDDPSFLGFGGFFRSKKVALRFSTVDVPDLGRYIVDNIYADLLDCDNRSYMTYSLGSNFGEYTDLAEAILQDFSHQEKLTLQPIQNSPKPFSDLNHDFVVFFTDVCSGKFTPGSVDMRKYL